MKKIIIIIICCLIFVGMPFGIKAQESLLTTPDEHTQFIRRSLESAKERVIIVSPYISSRVLQDDIYNHKHGLGRYIRAAIERGIDVCVYTDKYVDSKNPRTASNTQEGRKILEGLDVGLKIVSKLHSKNLITDNNCITFGSFNWLSATTDPTSDFCNYETTTILRNEQAYHAINKVLEGLSQLQVTDQKGVPDFGIVKMISDKSQLEEVLELFRSTQHSYIRHACSNALCEHLVFGCETDTTLYILRQTGDVDAECFSYFIDNVFESLIEDCETASDYEKLAQFFVEINKKEIAGRIELAKHSAFENQKK
jgi:hypothetical protein